MRSKEMMMSMKNSPQIHFSGTDKNFQRSFILIHICSSVSQVRKEGKEHRGLVFSSDRYPSCPSIGKKIGLFI